MQGKSKHILAHILSAYGRRELDRRVYDRFMKSSLGQRLNTLGPVHKHATEFFIYLAAAYALERAGSRTGFRTFVDGILADAPPEIGKRMWREAGGTSRENLQALNDSISDVEVAEMDQFADHVENLVRDNTGVDWSAMAESVRRSRTAMREKGRRIRSFGLLGRKSNKTD